MNCLVLKVHTYILQTLKPLHSETATPTSLTLGGLCVCECMPLTGHCSTIRTPSACNHQHPDITFLSFSSSKQVMFASPRSVGNRYPIELS